jgi:hypothetical protein
MSSLRLKRFFLSEKDREVYEENLINEMPELTEGIFYLDDEELENLQKQIKMNQMEIQYQKNPFKH